MHFMECFRQHCYEIAFYFVYFGGFILVYIWKFLGLTLGYVLRDHFGDIQGRHMIC